MEIEGGYLSTIKAIYDQPIADTFSTVKSLKHFLKEQDKDVYFYNTYST